MCRSAAIDFFKLSKAASLTKRVSGTSSAEDADGARPGGPGKYTHVAIYSKDGKTIGRTLLEVASTDEEKARGLMGRSDMPSVCGMLFKGLGGGHFWMKNCLMPIDVMFVRDGEVTKTYSMEPDGGKRRYPYDDETEAIELKGGSLERLGIAPGCRVRVSRLPRLPRPSRPPSRTANREPRTTD